MHVKRDVEKENNLFSRPLQEWLERKVGEEEIPVGW